MKVLVSLINYNSRDFIISCLKDIFAQECPEHSFKVVVFDNDSPDKSADEIKEKFPKIILIKNDENLGFGKAHTIVAKEFIDEYDAMLLVNPDVSFKKETFEKMFNRFENENIGILSGKIKKSDKALDSNGGDFPFGFALLNWLFNLEMLGIKTNFHRTDLEYYESFHPVDWVGGTFMLIGKEVIQRVGLFDRDYFMYFEDTELCYRARKKGFGVFIDSEFEVIHHSGGSSDNPRFFQWSNEYKNLLLFYSKNFGAFGSLLVRILVYISIVLRIVAFGVLGKTKTAQTYMKVIGAI